MRKHGISRATYFNWRSKYAGTSVSEGDYILVYPNAARSEKPIEIVRFPDERLRTEYGLTHLGPRTTSFPWANGMDAPGR